MSTHDKTASDTRCGFASIIGRPNVGKSTLLNGLVGQKISITSRKPQTTQRRINGISTEAGAQVIYVDTPGLQSRYSDALNQYMKKEINGALVQIDAVIFVVEALKWSEADEAILALIKDSPAPVILTVNKIDKVRDKKLLLPFLAEVAEKRKFQKIIPLSARKHSRLDELQHAIRELMPPGPLQYPDEQVSDRSVRFLAAEFIREKLINSLGKEVPYKLTVSIEKFSENQDGIEIDAIVWVESNSQKSIVIGKEGKVLKSAGERARKDMQNLLQQKVFLRTWVKVRKNWTRDNSALVALGYEEEGN